MPRLALTWLSALVVRALSARAWAALPASGVRPQAVLAAARDSASTAARATRCACSSPGQGCLRAGRKRAPNCLTGCRPVPRARPAAPPFVAAAGGWAADRDRGSERHRARHEGPPGQVSGRRSVLQASPPCRALRRAECLAAASGRAAPAVRTAGAGRAPTAALLCRLRGLLLRAVRAPRVPDVDRYSGRPARAGEDPRRRPARPVARAGAACARIALEDLTTVADQTPPATNATRRPAR